MSPRPIKVMIVDDEASIRLAVEFLLNKEGYEVYTAENGKDCLQSFNEVKPDIVILDVMMPEMDGFETARNLMSTYEVDQFRIVFLTAKGTPKDRLSGYSSGAERYMVKPFDNDQLLAEISEISSEIS